MVTPSDNPDDHVSKILGELQALSQSAKENQPAARQKMLSLSFQLTAALETPSEMIQRVGWMEVENCF